MTKDHKITLMEVCGTHTMAIARTGIKKILPRYIKMVSGPGCPVCVTAQNEIDRAIITARLDNVIMTTFGDMMRVPGSMGSLLDMKRRGCDIRVVYSCLDALEVARKNPKKQVVFMGVGFETTAPTIAATIIKAKKEGICNFSILSNFKLVFPALEVISRSKRLRVDGFLCPGHVSVITGSAPYEKIAKRYKRPCVITGFEPADIIRGIERLVLQVRERRHAVEIEYKRAVTKCGNASARRALAEVFSTDDAVWRGLGPLKKSGLKFKKNYAAFDAAKKFKVTLGKPISQKGCMCGDILQGIKSPKDCKLFKRVCKPQNPIGPCMVSSEGTCAAYFTYGE